MNNQLFKSFTQLSPRVVLAGTFMVFLGPFLLVELFPSRLDTVIEKSSYVVFHNTAEFFSIMVSLAVFSVGWYTHDQSKDRHALFLGTAFLAVGLIDFMHTMSNAAMPDFITPNSTNKSTQFWIAARLLDTSAFLVSAFVYPQSQSRWLSKTALITTALAVSGLLFTGVVFFSSSLPATAVQGVGLTPLKRVLEFVVILLLIGAGIAYWRRLKRTGDRLLIYYLAAFIICIFSEAVFASYKIGFDTYNVLGHIYKVVAFFLIYKGIFIASVREPYLKLENMSDKVNMLNAELEQRVMERTSQLEAANKELEAFIYSVSHDLRAPLRSMSGFARFLAEDYADRLDDKGKDYLTRINLGSEKMSRLIEDLLHLSKISRQEIDRTKLDLSAAAYSIISELRSADPGRSVDINIREGVTAFADPGLTEIVLSNLLGNAWKFTSKTDKAFIEFGTVEKDGKTLYYVRDNGAGFDPLYREKIFSPFERLHSDKEFDGTGIGLTIVERIVRRHGGKVWAEGEVGKGAAVYFILE